MSVKNFDPSRHAVSFLGIQILDFQEGTWIDVERHEDQFTSKAGSLGDVVVNRSLDRRGKITLTLMSTGQTNDLLSAILADAEQFGLISGLTLGTFSLKELNGFTRVHTESAWIMKQPKIERGNQSGSSVWVFEAAQLRMTSGSNLNA